MTYSFTLSACRHSPASVTHSEKRFLIFKTHSSQKTVMVEQIPREKIENGITLCLNRVSEYLLDAEGLSNQSASQGTLQNAAILVTFAIEELGKSIILRKRSEEQSDPKSVQVEREAFGGRDAREHKQSEAFTQIDAKLKLLPRAAFSAAAFGPDIDRKDVDISPDTRLKLSFVDFANGDWSRSPPIEPRRLKALVIGAKEVLKSEQATQDERFKKRADQLTANGSQGLPILTRKD